VPENTGTGDLGAARFRSWPPADTAAAAPAVDALFKAVNAALADVLEGHPRLVGYDVHALAEGPEAEGLVIVAIGPPAGEGARSKGPVQRQVGRQSLQSEGPASRRPLLSSDAISSP
jgi:hypothetical protein